MITEGEHERKRTRGEICEEMKGDKHTKESNDGKNCK
jgi:hypothetical protein